MPERCPFDYAIIRIVPQVDREEFFNAGVIVSCADRRFLKARVEFDPVRLAAFAPAVDREQVRKHLEAIRLICDGGDGAGPIGRLPERARFHWLVAPRSTVIQVSPVHSGLCTDPQETLDCLFEKMVRLPDAGPPDRA